MDRSRNLIIILIVIILILIIALVGAMLYIFINQDNNNNNNEIVVDNSANSGNVVDNDDEDGDVNNITSTEPSDEEVEGTEENEEPETPEEQEQPQDQQTPSQGNNDMDKAIFNTVFMAYVGNINGDRLNSLLQVIQDSNTKYPEHQITLSSNNLQTLEGIVSTDIYTITLSYDDNGYIKNINIDKKM